MVYFLWIPLLRLTSRKSQEVKCITLYCLASGICSDVTCGVAHDILHIVPASALRKKTCFKYVTWCWFNLKTCIKFLK